MPSPSPGKSPPKSPPASSSSSPKLKPSPNKLSLQLTPPDKPSPTEEHTPTEGAFRPRGFSSLFGHGKEKERKDDDSKTVVMSPRPGPSTLTGLNEDTQGHVPLTHSWWGEHDKVIARPPRHQSSLPTEQSLAYERTKAAVIRATHYTLGASIQLGKEALVVGQDLLEFAPIPGLAVAARVVLSIWEAVEMIETNRLSCLRLTERCANILYSVRLEVQLVGGAELAATLQEPLDKLTETFLQISHFIHKQVSRPFLKRYLKRDEDARKIEAADASLNDAVSLFGVAVQVRMLRGIQELGERFGGVGAQMPQAVAASAVTGGAAAEISMTDEMRAVWDVISAMSPTAPLTPIPTRTPLPSTAVGIKFPTQTKPKPHPLLSLPPTLKEEDLLATINALRAHQAARDARLDLAELYGVMRAALRSGDDFEMLEALQIGRGELQEAIKTLQRALEDPRLNVSTPPVSAVSVNSQKTLPPVPEGSSSSSDQGHPQDPSDTPSGSAASTYYTLPSSPHTTLPPTTPLPPVLTDPSQDAAFHREFLETGLEALRRLSDPVKAHESGTAGMGDRVEGLPAWTITRWEVDREFKIGVGFFSDVYKGVWRGRGVAIKILAPSTPRKLFQHETRIWAYLQHPNVLELLGASSATGDPPWFFVSPYMKNGSLVGYLRGREREKEKARRGGEVRGRERSRKASPGPLQMMYEIAVGMTYLHRKGVLHGDLKANNVLIDDELHCVISDFGQSELRSEVYRLSQKPKPHGATRWQAPEIMSGEGVLSGPVDVYAFGITCVEILTSGELPWPLLDDQSVQVLVLRHNKRPKIPLRPETSLALVTLIEESWATEATARPTFLEVAKGLGHLLGGLRGSRISPSPRSRTSSGSNGVGRVEELIREREHKRSPDMKPIELPPEYPPDAVGQDAWENLSQETLVKSPGTSGSIPLRQPQDIPLQRIVTPTDAEKDYKHHYYHSELSQYYEGTDSPGSILGLTHASSEADRFSLWGGYESPIPQDARVALRRDERRYRLLLQHEFHPTLNLPLWEPAPVRIGAVGYLSKPSGEFVTFFNALNPLASSDKRVHDLPSIYGYGKVLLQSAPTQPKRGLMEIVSGLLTFNKKPPIGAGVASYGSFPHAARKRYSFPLRAGHKHAYLCTEGTTYRYMENIDAAKAWFKANVKVVLEYYGEEYNLHKEDVYLVIGTLETHDYGLFVSHEHPDGQVHFNVYGDRKEDQDWGIFSTDSDPTLMVPGPAYDGDGMSLHSVYASKISKVRDGGGEMDSVLLARLRFRPDEEDPTRL